MASPSKRPSSAEPLSAFTVNMLSSAFAGKG
jgi:hypothetical protein